MRCSGSCFTPSCLYSAMVSGMRLVSKRNSVLVEQLHEVLRQLLALLEATTQALGQLLGVGQLVGLDRGLWERDP